MTGTISTELNIKLPKTFKQLLQVCNLIVLFKITSHTNYCFNFKNEIKRELQSFLMYKFSLNVTAAVVNILVKPINIIESKLLNILASLHLQKNLLEINLRLQLYVIRLLVRLLIVLKIFPSLLQVHAISKFKFRKVYWNLKI